jgi:hypothetical protein
LLSDSPTIMHSIMNDFNGLQPVIFVIITVNYPI